MAMNRSREEWLARYQYVIARFRQEGYDEVPQMTPPHLFKQIREDLRLSHAACVNLMQQVRLEELRSKRPRSRWAR